MSSRKKVNMSSRLKMNDITNYFTSANRHSESTDSTNRSSAIDNLDRAKRSKNDDVSSFKTTMSSVNSTDNTPSKGKLRQNYRDIIDVFLIAFLVITVVF
jgi:hypothetical protein